ncbi:hypothetical protein NKG60_28225 [Mesorhizobium sp. M1428]|uniref:hypothetical protein n=1 Tax=Mesorhizobium sp. M1428 TaxID=2957102 RepID=UPI00333D53E9
MAVLASCSWTGFVVKNSYVESQNSIAKRQEGRARATLGWSGLLRSQMARSATA